MFTLLSSLIVNPAWVERSQEKFLINVVRPVFYAYSIRILIHVYVCTADPDLVINYNRDRECGGIDTSTTSRSTGTDTEIAQFTPFAFSSTLFVLLFACKQSKQRTTTTMSVVTLLLRGMLIDIPDWCVVTVKKVKENTKLFVCVVVREKLVYFIIPRNPSSGNRPLPLRWMNIYS